jgi:hypothetical protein
MRLPRRRRRLRKDRYPLYLRILDAGAAGARLVDISRVLYPNLTANNAQDRVRKEQESARYLAREGYIYIAEKGR